MSLSFKFFSLNLSSLFFSLISLLLSLISFSSCFKLIKRDCIAISFCSIWAWFNCLWQINLFSSWTFCSVKMFISWLFNIKSFFNLFNSLNKTSFSFLKFIKLFCFCSKVFSKLLLSFMSESNINLFWWSSSLISKYNTGVFSILIKEDNWFKLLKLLILPELFELFKSLSFEFNIEFFWKEKGNSILEDISSFGGNMNTLSLSLFTLNFFSFL